MGEPAQFSYFIETIYSCTPFAALVVVRVCARRKKKEQEQEIVLAMKKGNLRRCDDGSL